MTVTSDIGAVEIASRINASEKPVHLNLLLISLSPTLIFAGAMTALTAGVQLAEKLEVPLRLVILRNDGVGPEVDNDNLRELLRQNTGIDLTSAITLVRAEDAADLTVSEDDYWFATFWSTALAARDLVARGVARQSRVAYLIQDFEPGFYPWGGEFVNALNTYSSGFHNVVNSASLATFLADRTGLRVDDQLVFEPVINVERLVGSAALWAPSRDQIRILMYGRPNHPRNLFTMAVEAMSAWIESLPEDIASRLVVNSAGQKHDDIDLGRGVTLVSLGKLSIDDYYEQLGSTDVGLALMYSPHPGHLALEMAMAGIPTVSNRLEAYRLPWVDGLELCSANPSGIARALDAVLEKSRSLLVHSPGELVHSLGVPLGDAIAELARRLTDAPDAEVVDRPIDSTGYRVGNMVDRDLLVEAEIRAAEALDARDEARVQLEEQRRLADGFAEAAKARAEEVSKLIARVVAAEDLVKTVPTRNVAQLQNQLAKQRAISNRFSVRVTLALVKPLEGAYRRVRGLRSRGAARSGSKGTGR